MTSRACWSRHVFLNLQSLGIVLTTSFFQGGRESNLPIAISRIYKDQAGILVLLLIVDKIFVKSLFNLLIVFLCLLINFMLLFKLMRHVNFMREI